MLVEAGFTGDEAIAVLAGKWRVLDKRDRRPRPPETREQMEFIRGWRARSVG